MASRSWRVWLCGLLLAGCSESAGRFSVTFSFVDEAPAAGSVWVHAFLEERASSPEDPGNEVSRAPAVLFGDGPLVFEQLVYGNNRVVVVQLREEQDPRSPLLYFGTSQPFDLQPGSDVQVEVLLALRRAPQLRADLPLLNAPGGFVRDPLVMLQLEAQGAELLEVAQDPNFTVGYVALEEGDSSVTRTSTQGGFTHYSMPYDLNTDQECQGEECDGPRRLFARVSGREQLRSSTVQASAMLDGTPPGVEFISRAYEPGPDNPLALPSAATAETIIILSITFTEALAEVPTVEARHEASGSTLLFEVVESSPISPRYEALVPEGLRTASTCRPCAWWIKRAGRRRSPSPIPRSVCRVRRPRSLWINRW